MVGPLLWVIGRTISNAIVIVIVTAAIAVMTAINGENHENCNFSPAF